MTEDTLLLISRGGSQAREVFETHANRLERRGVAGSVRVTLYEREPVRELAEEFAALDADRVRALPLSVAHDRDTAEDIPGALSYVPGETYYGDPIGTSPAVTRALIDRAGERLALDDRTSVLLVGYGDSSRPHARRAIETHAARIRDRTDADEVSCAYLLQNPAVECARYTVTNDRVVAVPVFFASDEITEERIPAKLELDRGGIEYASPVGTHPKLTDAIHAEAAKTRVLDDGQSDTGDDGTANEAGSDISTVGRTAASPLVTDGEGSTNDVG